MFASLLSSVFEVFVAKLIMHVKGECWIENKDRVHLPLHFLRQGEDFLTLSHHDRLKELPFRLPVLSS